MKMTFQQRYMQQNVYNKVLNCANDIENVISNVWLCLKKSSK